jgi:predicted O-methyltransferase YrrM
MKTLWTAGLEKERTVDVRQNFKEALVLRQRLRELLDKKIEASVRESRSKDSYDLPNWAYVQADKRGYERALQEIFDLLSD